MTTYTAIFAGLLAAALIIFGWKVSDWHKGSLDAQSYRELFVAEQARGIKYQADLLAAQNKLKERKVQIEIRTKEVIKRVKQYIPNNRACDLNAHVVELLNAARAGELPPPAPGTDAASPAP